MELPLPLPLQPDSPGARPYANPYLAGIGLGLTLLLSYLVLGTGLGASATPARAASAAVHLIAPQAVENNAYVGGWFQDGSPLSHYLVFMTLGALVGGLVSVRLARRVKFGVERGPTAPLKLRLVLAVVGGTLVGFASRLAAGCTSGQALSGGALLLSGSWAFMIALFVGAFGAARFVRREWT